MLVGLGFFIYLLNFIMYQVENRPYGALRFYLANLSLCKDRGSGRPRTRIHYLSSRARFAS